MKSSSLIVASVIVISLGTAALAAAAKDKPHLTLTAASEVAFDDMFASQSGGPKIGTVSGDRNKGAHISLVKFPPGMVAPLHTHTNESEGIVIAGVMSHWEEGESQASAKRLPPGSYFKEPAMIKHYTACAPGAECIAAIIQHGKWDGNPVKTPEK